MSIILEIAAASKEHEMWERRWRALHQIYAIERIFADSDGRWGLRDVLDYMGQACGFSRDTDRSGEADETAKQAQPEGREPGRPKRRHRPNLSPSIRSHPNNER